MVEMTLNFQVTSRIDNESLSLFFSDINEDELKQCESHTLVLGCELVVHPATKKFQVLKIPVDSLKWDKAAEQFPLEYHHESGNDCAVISWYRLSETDRVKSRIDYMDSIIFDTQDDKVVRIEVVSASMFL